MDIDQSAGVILIDPLSKYVLFVKQRESKKWGVPKGHLKENESLWRGALRELFEETGIALKRRNYFRKRRPYLVSDNKYVFVVRLKHKCRDFVIFDTDEVDDVKWAPIDQLRLIMKKYPHNIWVRAAYRILKKLNGDRTGFFTCAPS